MTTLFSLWLILFFLIAVPVLAAAVDFEAVVRPILSRHCYDCHGDGHRKGGLSLQTEAEALSGGDSLHPAYVKGDSATSAILQRITSSDPALRMPPKGEPVPEAEIAALRAWVDAGASWGAEVVGTAKAAGSEHWAYQPPVQAPLPTVKRADWARNPIDAFVLARLEAEGLAPSPEADRYTLCRRAYLDITGLPPSPEAVEAFVADTRPDAYERLVDELLASPHYGERMAVPWLDAARYADTNGFEKDRPRSIWPYRDWVINAFNHNLPYDRFLIEQYAGDMLPNATQEQRIATGFLRNTMINEEGGVDQEEYRYEAVVDRVNTTGAVVLGLTLACAQCHTHKYDAITQREYFQFMAFLNNADEVEVPVIDPAIARQREEALAAIRAREAALPEKFPIDPALRVVTPISPAQADAASGAPLAIEDHGVIVAWGAAADRDTYTLVLDAPAGTYTALQIEALASADGKTGPGRAENGNFVLTGLSARVFAPGGAAPRDLAFARAEADAEQPGFPVRHALDGDPGTGWAIDVPPNGPRANRIAVFHLDAPLSLAQAATISLNLAQEHGKQHLLGRFRIALVSENVPGGDYAAARAAHLENRLNAWRAAMRVKAVPWTIADVVAAKSKNQVTFVPQRDKSVLVKGDNPNTDEYTVSIRTEAQGITAIRLEVLPDPSLPGGGPGRGIIMSPNEGDFLLSEIAVTVAPWAAPDQAVPVAIAGASQDFAAPGREASKALDGKLDTGWSVMGGEGQPHQAVFSLAQPVGHPGGTLLTLKLDQYYVHLHTIGRFRISVTSAPSPVLASGLPAEVEAAFLAGGDESGASAALLRAHFLATAPELAGEHQQIAAMRKAVPKYPTSLVLEEREAHRVTRIHHRGEFLHPKEAVEPGVPAVLPPLPAGAPRNRLTLARWLAAPENPLTARVMVNRTWQMLLGRGLVNTPEDFGVRGEAPSHPELLDWLAAEFMRRGWDVKDLVRLIVTSAAYRQDSRVAPALHERDPANELLARGPRYRVDGEFVRDIALTASGQIAQAIGGPSVYPPLPAGMLELVYGGTSWKPSEGPDKYRRGLYTFWKRTLPYPTAITFDCPARDVSVLKRVRSNTPLQALTQLNDPVFNEAAQAMARDVLAAPLKMRDDRLRLAFLRCTSRPPDTAELARLAAFLDAQQARYAAGELDPLGQAPEQAAWAALCRALLNLDETISRG